MTNRDWLNKLSNVEFARLFMEESLCIMCSYNSNYYDCGGIEDQDLCTEGFESWLQQERPTIDKTTKGVVDND